MKKIEYVLDENGCHNCISHYLDRHGYPNIRRNGKNQTISRTMFKDIPEGMVVRHKCDNPRCINIKHLELGTMKQNTQDCIARGRFKFPPVNFGTKLKHAKLNDDIVVYMRNSGKTCYQLAKEFNIDPTTAYDAIKRKTWKHVR